jgi:assimilatory nitrate reductase catalytic subunit
MGPFSLTGQPNAMGGREVGGLANQLAAHMSFASAEDRDRVRRFWRAPNMASRPGLKAVDMFEAALNGRVKALWVLGTNPADSMPRADRVRAALTTCPFVVVSDCWQSDTADFADVLLPAAGWGEKDGTVTNSERRISRQRGFRPPPGEARPDWWMLSEVARRLGWGAAFSYRNSADIFREHAALSAFENEGRRVFDIGAFGEIGDAEYDGLVPAQWPLRRDSEATRRLFGDGRGFPATDGRARFVAVSYRPPAEAPEPEMLVLNTGRVRDQWHTMTRTGRVPRLMAHRTEPLLDTHGDDATRLGLRDGSLARVDSRHGAAVMRVRVSPEPRAGEVFVPMHWTDKFSSSGPIDRLVGGATDPISGQPELKATPVTVTRLETRWRGFLLRRSAIAPRVETGDEFYWSRIPIAAGHAYELAGWQESPCEADAEAWVMGLVSAPDDAELIVYVDQGRGALRYASLVDGCLDACLFLARNGVFLPGRAELEDMLGAAVEPPARLNLVAGLSASAPRVDSGPIICACFAVGLQTLRQAIVERELNSVAAIGEALRAGTNCGSCRPELRAILDTTIVRA